MTWNQGLCRNDEPPEGEEPEEEAPPAERRCWSTLHQFPMFTYVNWPDLELRACLGESLMCLGLWMAGTDRALRAYSMGRGRGRRVVAQVVENELRMERGVEVVDGGICEGESGWESGR